PQPSDSSPTAPPAPPPSPHFSRIQPWALAIQHEEGGKPQDLNTKLKNPGNLKYSTYTESLGGKCGPEASDGGYFCKLDTYEAGFKALCQFLRDAANDQLIGFHKARTLKAFTQVYAQPPKAHPYAENVAKALGVPVDIDIAELL